MISTCTPHLECQHILQPTAPLPSSGHRWEEPWGVLEREVRTWSAMVEKGASWVVFRLWGWGMWLGENVLMIAWIVKLLICLIPRNADAHKCVRYTHMPNQVLNELVVEKYNDEQKPELMMIPRDSRQEIWLPLYAFDISPSAKNGCSLRMISSAFDFTII